MPAGEYDVSLAFTAHSNRATSLSVQVFSAEGEHKFLIDQKNPRNYDGLWRKLGRFRFEDDGQAYVLISTAGSSGIVIADAVQFLPIDELPQSAASETSLEVAERNAEQTKSEIKKLEAELQQLKTDNKTKITT